MDVNGNNDARPMRFVSRRSFLAAAGASGALFASALGLAACSSGSSSGAASASAPAASSAALAAGSTGGASASTTAIEATPVVQGKSLIAYFSRAGGNSNGYLEEGNTEVVAMMLAGKVVADVFRIEHVEPYPDDYDACLDLAKEEQNAHARPALAELPQNFADYTTVYLGYPIWWSDMPMPVYTFLESLDWSGKIIAPFCTHGDSGLNGTVESLRSVCSGAEVLEGLAIKGEVAQSSRDEADAAVSAWLARVRS